MWSVALGIFVVEKKVLTPFGQYCLNLKLTYLRATRDFCGCNVLPCVMEELIENSTVLETVLKCLTALQVTWQRLGLVN